MHKKSSALGSSTYSEAGHGKGNYFIVSFQLIHFFQSVWIFICMHVLYNIQVL